MSPRHPMCWICGVVIGAKLDSDPVGAKLPVYNSEQIRGEALRWCNLFRAIIFRRHKQDSPVVSGVGCFTDPQDVYTPVPQDQEAKYDDDPSPVTLDVVPVHPQFQVENHADVYAYLIHSCCWDFLEDSLGNTIYSKLVPLAHVLKTRRVDEDYGGAKPLLSVVWAGGRNERQSTVEFVTDPVDVPEVLNLRENLTRCIGQDVTDTESNKSIDQLPMELKFMVLDDLEYYDVQSALSALGWKIPAHYWRKRFRSELFFEFKNIVPQENDWYSLWFASEDLLHKKPSLGLSNRLRIFTILSAVTRDLNSYGSLYHAGESSVDLDHWSIIYKSVVINEVSNIALAVSIPPIIDKLCFSFVAASNSDGLLLSGIKILPGASTLGYCRPDEALPEAAIFSVPTKWSGLMVKLDAKGIRDIMPMCKDSPSRWILGFESEGSSVGQLFDDEDSAGIQICAMVDANMFTAIGSILKNKYAVQCAQHEIHDCFRQSQLWRPDIPLASYNLNEDQYPGGTLSQGSAGAVTPRKQLPYRPLRYVIFGGEHGELLSSLKSVKAFRAQKWFGVTGLEFFYDDDTRILFGSRGEFESELPIQGRQGEYVQEIECHYRAGGLKTWSLEMRTNQGHSMKVAIYEEEDPVVSNLVVPHGERIVGFYTGPGNWLSHGHGGGLAEDFAGFGIITTTKQDS